MWLLLLGRSLACTTSLSITFGGNAVNCGNVLTPQQTANVPTISLLSATPNNLYTIMLIDPDAPSAADPSLSPIRHWVVGNVNGSDLANGVVSGMTLSSFIGPAPPIGSGLHRYNFSVWLQPSLIAFDPIPTVAPLFGGITLFDYEGWASSLSLQLVAFNYFVAKWTDGYNYTCTSTPLTVSYGSKAVNCGNTFTPQETASIPSITYAAAAANAYYTVIMADPDALSAADPALSPIRHWVIGNVPGQALSSGSLAGGVTLDTYIGPGPPIGTGLHRYYISVWLQPGNLTFGPLPVVQPVFFGRTLFDFQSWAAGLSLQLVSANHFVAKWADAYNYTCRGNLTVSYGSKSVSCGSQLTPQETASVPSITYSSAVANNLYTIIMVDPDALSAADPSLSPIRHWVIGNVAGQALAAGSVTGATLSPYVGPGPPINTGFHRYYISVWLQPGNLTFTPITTVQPLFNGLTFFDFQSWANSYSLQLVAANYFQAQYTDAGTPSGTAGTPSGTASGTTIQPTKLPTPTASTGSIPSTAGVLVLSSLLVALVL